MREDRICCQLRIAASALRRYWKAGSSAVVASVLWAVPGGGGASEAVVPPPAIGLGKALTAEEIERYAITVFPDGRGLPQGRGTVEQGARLYQMQCAACHGARGIEGPASRLVGTDGFIGWSDPLRPLRVRKYPLQVFSVGAMWPHATTLFDYVRRGMPMHAPKSLTDEEVYAVTGYVLHLNGLVARQAVMDRETLPKVVMPGLARTVSAWPAER
ncbi:c-type cytochrome [Acidovorax sp. BL-A-41-H1]|uniref:c-type cytochrome n=1 Tax=Acidovorax sp. BL-A-41-H1 TaxID=3421102 RepID=UPI003F791F8D